MRRVPFHFLEFLQGVDTQTQPFLLVDDKLTILDNCLVSYKLGAITKRLGYYKVGDTLQSGKTITGLHNFRQTASVQKILATINNSDDTNLTLQYNNAGSWDPINVGSTYDGYEDAKTEMEDFIGYCFIVGYDATDGVFLPVASLTGTTFSTSTNVTSMPQGKYIKRYRDRLYVANCYTGGAAYPYRIYYSSVPSAGAISWTVSTDFLEVDYSEEVTGIGENWDKMIVFTEFSAYMYNQDEKKKVWDIGCSNHRTIKNSGTHLLWANRDGVWDSTGGFPNNVAGRVIDFIKFGNPRNFFAEVVDEEYYLYVGTVTVNGITFTNTRLVYNIPTQTWRIEELYTNMKVFASYNDSGTLRLYMGDGAGIVWNQSKYTDTTKYYADAYVDVNDTGQPIHAWFQSKPFDFKAPSTIKEFLEISAYADRAMGLQLKARVLDNNVSALTEFKPLCELRKFITDKITVNPNKGNLLQIEGVENSKNPYFSFYGLSVIVGVDEEFK
jgi:hypothetical protein